MLQAILLRNFQRHANSRIELHPGVNVITGQSDQGKSSVLRAINWTLYGRPKGTGFRRHDAPEEAPTIVTLKFDDGVITKKRTKATTTYKIDGTELAALAGAVPNRAADLANVPEDSVQQQIDTPFLIGMSSGDVARKLNLVAGFDIDEVFKRIGRKASVVQVELAAQTTQVKDLKAALELLPDADLIDRLTAKAEKLQTQHSAATAKSQALTAAIGNYRTHKQVVRKIAGRLDAASPQLEVVLELRASIRRARGRWADWSTFIAQVQAGQKAVNIFAVSDEARALSEKATVALRSMAEVRDTARTLAQAIEGYRTARTAVAERARELETLNEKMHKLKAQLGACPLCGHVLEGE